VSAAGLGHGVCAAGLPRHMSATGLTCRMSAAGLTQRLPAIGLASGMSAPGLSRRLGCMPGPGVAAAGLTGSMPGTGLTGMACFRATRDAWTCRCSASLDVVVFAIWHGLESKTFRRTTCLSWPGSIRLLLTANNDSSRGAQLLTLSPR
jgi:hypothetical protein